MRFFLKRYLHVVSVRRRWLLLLFIPPLAYLLIAAIIPDRFSIVQTISIPENASVQLGKKPGASLPVSEIASRPEIFFQDGFALILLKRELDPGTVINPIETPLGRLKTIVENGMTLALRGKKTAVITYEGEDRNLGKELVSFYSRRLVDKIKAGGAKSKPGDGNKQPSATLIGQTETEEYRTLWRGERLFPSLGIAIISLGVILIIIALLEWSDSSFKSERQVARYLELPILGSLPDLEKIPVAMAAVNNPPQAR